VAVLHFGFIGISLPVLLDDGHEFAKPIVPPSARLAVSELSLLLEHTYELGWSSTPRCCERCVPVLSDDIGAGSRSEQTPNHRHITAQRSDEKRRASPSVGLFRADSAAEELLDPFEVS
jgi:hypothetical protein